MEDAPNLQRSEQLPERRAAAAQPMPPVRMI